MGCRESAHVVFAKSAGGISSPTRVRVLSKLARSSATTKALMKASLISHRLQSPMSSDMFPMMDMQTLVEPGTKKVLKVARSDVDGADGRNGAIFDSLNDVRDEARDIKNLVRLSSNVGPLWGRSGESW